MKFLKSLLGILGLRSHAIHSLAEPPAVFRGILCFAVGYLAYAFVRNSVYAELMVRPTGGLYFLINIQIMQVIVFLSLVYVPVIILGANTLFGKGAGFIISGRNYAAHVSALFPIWSLLFLIAIPLQWCIHGLIVEIGDNSMVIISIGIMIRSLLLIFYTLWAVGQLNTISYGRTFGVLAISCLTFPVYYIFVAYWMAIPIFLLILLIFWAISEIRRRQIAKAKALDIRDLSKDSTRDFIP
jgi:hypothetical protein